MIIRCTCGLNIGSIFHWPPAEIEEGGKKMMERHLSCNCGREIVVRTAPKEEPDSPENADKKGIFSFDEIARRMGAGQMPDQPSVQPAPDSPTAIIQEINAIGNPALGLNAEDAELLQTLVRNYGTVFKPIFKQEKSKRAAKQGEQMNEQEAAQAKEQQEYLAFADKIIEGLVSFSPEEAKMARCSFTERNLDRLYPTTDFDLDTDYNVIMRKKVAALETRVFAMFETAGL